MSHAFAASGPPASTASPSSRRKRATSMERSKERGSISPVHEGTVGRRPVASRTKTFIPRTRSNW